MAAHYPNPYQTLDASSPAMNAMDPMDPYRGYYSGLLPGYSCMRDQNLGLLSGKHESFGFRRDTLVKSRGYTWHLHSGKISQNMRRLWKLLRTGPRGTRSNALINTGDNVRVLNFDDIHPLILDVIFEFEYTNTFWYALRNLREGTSPEVTQTRYSGPPLYCIDRPTQESTNIPVFSNECEVGVSLYAAALRLEYDLLPVIAEHIFHRGLSSISKRGTAKDMEGVLLKLYLMLPPNRLGAMKMYIENGKRNALAVLLKFTQCTDTLAHDFEWLTNVAPDFGEDLAKAIDHYQCLGRKLITS
ncbi:hypothetical protein BCR34DRAFT_600855 [Clohesyomyces aquaticus]|uniref:Uncharacterized protein n=1 Tax=Clohesyomyces aquaticus TaxID=1231657 RepID=A0A1Y1ZPC9_9PLEO|nr:hypothetical protein BCR34DRAFT_600855 [Clohesyomyces aquaticus]